MNKNIIFGVVGIIAIGIVVFLNFTQLEPEPSIDEIDDGWIYPEEPKFDFEALEILKEYKGQDGTGDNVIDIIANMVDEDYPDATVLLNNQTFVEWYSFDDETQGEDIIKVGRIFKTFKEDSEYFWYVDKFSKNITAGNDASQEILEKLE